MKSFIVFALFVAAAVALPVVDDSKNAVVLKQYLENIGVEGYSYGLETSDGKTASEEGKLVDVGTENEAIAVRGRFSYIGTDGVTYTVEYTADRNGFHPQGAHLPVGPVV